MTIPPTNPRAEVDDLYRARTLNPLRSASTESAIGSFTLGGIRYGLLRSLPVSTVRVADCPGWPGAGCGAGAEAPSRNCCDRARRCRVPAAGNQGAGGFPRAGAGKTGT